MRSLSDYGVGDTFLAFHQGWGKIGPIYRIFTKLYEDPSGDSLVKYTDAEEGIGGRMVATSDTWYGVATPTSDGFVNLDAWNPEFYQYSKLTSYEQILRYAMRYSDGGRMVYFIAD